MNLLPQSYSFGESCSTGHNGLMIAGLTKKKSHPELSGRQGLATEAAKIVEGNSLVVNQVPK